MTPDEAVVAVFAALDAAAIPYMLVGSLASNFHGIPVRPVTPISSSSSGREQ